MDIADVLHSTAGEVSTIHQPLIIQLRAANLNCEQNSPSAAGLLRQAAAADEQGNDMLAELDALKSARAEIAALRSAIQQVGCDLTRAVAVGSCMELLHPYSESAHLSSHKLQPLVLQARHAQGGGSFSTTILLEYLTPDVSFCAGRKDHDDCTGGGGGSQHRLAIAPGCIPGCGR